MVGADVLAEVVVGKTADQDAGFAGDVKFVVRAVLGTAEQFGLFVGEVFVLDPGVDRQEGPLLDFLGGLERVLRPPVAGRHAGAAVGDPGHEPDHDRQRQLLGEIEGLEHHVVGLLLVAGLEARDQGELGEVAAVLLVLRRVHPRVIGHRQHEAPVGAGDGRVHESIGGNVEPDVFHAHEGPFPGPTHAQSFLVGDFFVGRPESVDVTSFFCPALDKFEDLGRRCARIAVDTAESGIDGTETDRLVSEENFSLHCDSLHGFDDEFAKRLTTPPAECEVLHNREHPSIDPGGSRGAGETRSRSRSNTNE